MIITRLMGGLGNQMFQYAIGRRIALLCNTALHLDISWLSKEIANQTKREYALSVFNLNIPIATSEELQKFNRVYQNPFKRIAQKIVPFFFPFITKTEKSYKFNETVLHSSDNTMLIGYWQTEKYFLAIKNILIKDFKFPGERNDNKQKILDIIKKRQSVSVHVRRGDYFNNNQVNEIHGNCGLEYYLTALDIIKGKIQNPQIFIFSDDLDWVKENMDFGERVIYVEGLEAGDDMFLMTQCNHNIIANSSFSWWGAWLNPNPGKVVIAPLKWFNTNVKNAEDIIPESWVKL